MGQSISATQAGTIFNPDPGIILKFLKTQERSTFQESFPAQKFKLTTPTGFISF